MATNRHHNYSDPSAHNAGRTAAGDWRYCVDCGAEYNARNGPCRRCPELTWCVWDAAVYEAASTGDLSAQEIERGMYERGFPSQAAAEAAIPRIIAARATVGIDVQPWQCVVMPE